MRKFTESKIEKMSDKEIKDKIEYLNNWKLVKNKLYGSYEFNDFKEAFSFITKIATLAEKHNHHPEINNIYNKVNIKLTTHDIGGISKKDIKILNLIEKL